MGFRGAGAGSVGRGLLIALWASIVVLLVGGGVAVATVDAADPTLASSAQLATLRGAPAALSAEPQLRFRQEVSVPAGLTTVCSVIRPATRCEQRMPTGRAFVNVSTPDGYYFEVPPDRRGTTGGKPWVRVDQPGGSAFSAVDAAVAVLHRADGATVRTNEPLDGSLVNLYRFDVPRQAFPTNAASAAAGMPADLQMSSVIEAWIDDRSRPLRMVQDVAMTSKTMSHRSTMTFTFTYEAIEPFEIPDPANAFIVGSAQEATKLVMGI
jgi:hypothetical protein